MAISKAQQKAVHNYVRNNYDRIELTVNPKGKKDQIKAHASERGETLNGAFDEYSRSGSSVVLAQMIRDHECSEL